MRLPWRIAVNWIIGPASRPSWLLDLKWLVGFACVVAVLAAGVLYSAAKLTERDPATGTFAAVMGALAKEGDGEEGFAEIKQTAVEHPNRDVTIEGVALPVKGSEIAGLTYGETVDLVFARLGGILYTEGPEAATRYLTDSPADGAATGAPADEGDIGPLSLLTQDNHDSVRSLFRYAIIPAALLLAALALLSTRFGRVGAPGVALAVGTGPLAGLWLIVRATTDGSGSDGLEASLSEALGPTAQAVAGDFASLFLVGAAMVVIAVAGQLVFTCCRLGFGLTRGDRGDPSPAETPPGDGVLHPVDPPGFLTGGTSGQDHSDEEVPAAGARAGR